MIRFVAICRDQHDASIDNQGASVRQMSPAVVDTTTSASASRWRRATQPPGIPEAPMPEKPKRLRAGSRPSIARLQPAQEPAFDQPPPLRCGEPARPRYEHRRCRMKSKRAAVLFVAAPKAAEQRNFDRAATLEAFASTGG